MPLNPGTTLGPYRILAPLGAGGMGEVYRAHDSRLGRDVAIKVLPQHLAATLELRARFEREARTVSQLNHSHICTLFDIGHQDGIDFLVMELIEGDTLAKRLEKGPLPTSELLGLGRQIADALDRAHRAGVVHRDLKPGNIMLTRGGAKLMDFGLARSTGLAGGHPSQAGPSGSSLHSAQTYSPTVATPLTAEGTLVGTFQYMSPEQLEGKEADSRSDLWAFGCVLYECATGARAFSGESQASLIAAIMTGEPRPLTQLRPVAPAGLERVVSQCLRKDPEARFQSAHDLVLALEVVAAADPVSAMSAGTGAPPARRRAAPWLPLTVAIALAVAAFVIGRATAPRPPQSSIRVSTLSQGSRDSEPSVSRDGRLVAFSAVRQNGQGIWIMDMVSRSEVKLTRGADHLARFTADGGSIIFSRTKDSRLSLWRIPVIGGAERLLLEGASDADPSPDGERLAFIAGSADSTIQRSQLVVAKADGTGGREMFSEGALLLSNPRWSPDGKRIAFVLSASQNSLNSIVVLDVATGAARKYPAPTGSVLSNPTWDGSGKAIVLAEGVGITAVQRGAPGRLLRLDPTSGTYQTLGWVENFPSSLDLLPDGRLVLSSLIVRQNLREVPVGARDLFHGRSLTTGLAMDRQPVYSPDGKFVMFSSNRGGTLDLWEASVETGEMHRVTDDPADDWDPEYSADDRSIYWCSSRSGAFEIWTARRDGSAPRQLSRDSLDAENPSASRDGQWVYYSSAHPRKSGLWRVAPADGREEFLLSSATLIPDLSPDARVLSVLTGLGTLEAELNVFDIEEKRLLPAGLPVLVQPGNMQVGRSRITPDGSNVVYVAIRADGHPILLRRPLSAWRTGVGRTDTLFAGATEPIESFDFSPDGKRAVVSVVDWLSGLSIAEGVAGFVPPKRK